MKSSGVSEQARPLAACVQVVILPEIPRARELRQQVAVPLVRDATQVEILLY